MEWDELSVLGAYKYPMEIQNQGFRFYHLPIVDAKIPSKNQARKLVGFIVHQLMEEGRSVMVHCYAGRGRSGTICACVLIHCGFSAVEAIAQVRRVRTSAIAHDCQVQFLKDYEANLQKHIESLTMDEMI
jgi:protein-tyrosine phosphatase